MPGSTKDHMNSVTITLNEDGTYTVEGQAGAQQAASPDEACDLALQMLGTPEAPESPAQEEAESFEAGFAGVRGA